MSEERKEKKNVKIKETSEENRKKNPLGSFFFLNSNLFLFFFYRLLLSGVKSGLLSISVTMKQEKKNINK